MYHIKHLAKKKKEMASFTRDGGHLGRHLEYLKFLARHRPDSNFIHLPLPKSAKTCLGVFFARFKKKIRVLPLDYITTSAQNYCRSL